LNAGTSTTITGAYALVIKVKSNNAKQSLRASRWCRSARDTKNVARLFDLKKGGTMSKRRFVEDDIMARESIKENNNTKTKFMEMFYNLPEQARKGLVYNYPIEPMTINVLAMEIRNNTKLGKKILKDLGYDE